MAYLEPTVIRTRRTGAVLATNKLIRNTYVLLAMTLAFSALTAGIAVMINMPPLHWLLTIGGYFALLFLTAKTANSAMGLVCIFALTGFMGLTLGPIISFYLHAFSNGPQLVMMAFGGTAAIFIGLSGYALTTKRDFSFLGGFLMVGILVAFLAGIAALVFSFPALSLAVSAMFILLMSGFILYQTSQLVHEPNTNYILATVGLYVSIYNLFTSLLYLFGIFGGDD
jgi:modulator of FtsH protease